MTGTGRHRRDELFARLPWVLIPGNRNNPGTWWRMPTLQMPSQSWTPDMKYGLGLLDGNVVEWDAATAGPRVRPENPPADRTGQARRRPGLRQPGGPPGGTEEPHA